MASIFSKNIIFERCEGFDENLHQTVATLLTLSADRSSHIENIWPQILFGLGAKFVPNKRQTAFLPFKKYKEALAWDLKGRKELGIEKKYT